MENQEEILGVLKSFEEAPSKDIPPILEDYFRSVAKTGKTLFPWQHLKMAFIQKVEQVMEQFCKEDPCDRLKPVPNVENTKFEELRQRIIDAMQKFTGAPFTVQRICELVTQPKKHYTQCDKFMRGIEKNVMVVSTVDPTGRKIVSESCNLVNGLDTNGLNLQQSDENDITDGKPFGPGPQVDWSGHNVSTVWPSVTKSHNKNNSGSLPTLSESPSITEQDITSDKLAAKPADTDKDTESEDKLVVTDSVVRDGGPAKASPIPSATDSDTNSEKMTCDTKENQDSMDDQHKESVPQEASMSLASDMSHDIENQSSSNSNNQNINSSSPSKHATDTTAEDEPPEKKLKVELSEPGTTENVSTDVAENTEESQVTDTPKTHEPETSTEEPEMADDQSQEETSQTETALTEDVTGSCADNDQKEAGKEPVNEENQSETMAQNNQDDTDLSENSLQNTIKSDSEDVNNIEKLPSDIALKDSNDDSCDSTGFPASASEESLECQEVNGADTDSGAAIGEVMDTDTEPNPEPVKEQQSKQEAETSEHPPTDESEPMEQE